MPNTPLVSIGGWLPPTLIPMLIDTLKESGQSYMEICTNVESIQSDLLFNGREDQKLAYLSRCISPGRQREFSDVVGLYLLSETGLGENLSRLRSVRLLPEIQSYKKTLESLHPETNFSYHNILRLWRLSEILKDMEARIFSSPEDPHIWFPLALLAITELEELGAESYTEIGLSHLAGTSDIEASRERLYREYSNTLGKHESQKLILFISRTINTIVVALFPQRYELIEPDTKKILSNVLEHPVENNSIDVPLIGKIQKQGYQ